MRVRISSEYFDEICDEIDQKLEMLNSQKRELVDSANLEQLLSDFLVKEQDMCLRYMIYISDYYQPKSDDEKIYCKKVSELFCILVEVEEEETDLGDIFSKFGY